MKQLAGALTLVLAACSATSRTPLAEPDSAAGATAPPAVVLNPRQIWSPPSALDAQAAAVPMPATPPAQRPSRDAGAPAAQARDQSGDLVRNASVVGRLPEPGQRASFPFESEAGEQSLFEIVANGYSRGSAGRVRMSIEDASGSPVWQSERDVGVTWRDFAAFAPASSGAHTFSLTVLEGGYRFVLVRHSDYPVLGDAPLALGTRQLVHGHLPNAEAQARFSLPVSAGEELCLKLTGTREEARVEARHGATDMSAMSARMDSKKDAGRMRGGANLLFQSFELEALADGVALGPIGPFLRLRAPRDGSIEVRVRARRPALGGGLFDLAVERPLELLNARGVVVDSEDQPLSGVEIVFLREPDGDPVGRSRTDGNGEYQATVLAGDLAIQMVHEQRPAVDSVRVHVSGDTQMDLLFRPGAPPRGR